MKKNVILGFIGMLVALFVFFHAILTPNTGIYRIYMAPIVLIAACLFSTIVLVLYDKEKKNSRKNSLEKKNEENHTCYVCTNSIKKGEKYLKNARDEYFHEDCGFDPMQVN